VLEQFGEPLGVEHVALAAGQDLHVVRVDQPQLERALIQDVPDRFPVRAGRLHRDVGDALVAEPVAQLLERAGERREGAGVLAPSASAGPGVRTQATTSFLPMSIPAQRSIRTSIRGLLVLDPVGDRPGRPINDAVKRVRDNRSRCREGPWLSF
jgi:hypothetical protein